MCYARKHLQELRHWYLYSCYTAFRNVHCRDPHFAVACERPTLNVTCATNNYRSVNFNLVHSISYLIFV